MKLEESGAPLIMNDMLCYVQCKINVFSKKKLLITLQNFYSQEEASVAIDLMMMHLSDKEAKDSMSYITNNKQSPFKMIIQLYQLLCYHNSCPVYLCKNLTNIPKTSNRTKSLRHSLETIKLLKIDTISSKNKIDELVSVIRLIKEQFQTLINAEKFEKQKILEKKLTDSTKVAYQSPIKKSLSYLQKLIDEENQNFKSENETIFRVDASKIKNEIEPFGTNIFNEEADLEEFTITDDLPTESGDFEVLVNGNLKSTTTRLPSYKECLNALNEKGTCYNRSKRKIDSGTTHQPINFSSVEDSFDEKIGHYSIYKCPTCQFCSNNESILLNHKCKANEPLLPIKNEHSRNTKSRTYRCYNCSKVFQNLATLRFHKRTKHANEVSNYKCPLCSTKLPKELWEDHVRFCVQLRDDISESDIRCSVCHVFFASPTLLKNHKPVHDQSRPFQCTECSYRFYSQKSVGEHLKNHYLMQQTNVFKCPFCMKVFLRDCKLEEHVRSHTGDRPFKCKVCDQTFGRYAGLRAHELIHVEGKQYNCDLCDKTFKLKHKLMVHKTVSHGKGSDRPFKCSECGKGYRTGRQMTTHYKTHLGIRNFPCPHCPYRAANASILKEHINVHMNTKPFKCQYCDFCSNHRSYLSNHMKIVHKVSKTQVQPFYCIEPEI